MFSPADYFSMFVGLLIGRAAFYFVYTIGIVLALSRWQRHPSVSRRAVVGFGLLLLTSVCGIFYQLWEYGHSERGWTVEQASAAHTICVVIIQIISVVAYGNLIAAIFGCRPLSARDQAKPLS